MRPYLFRSLASVSSLPVFDIRCASAERAVAGTKAAHKGALATEWRKVTEFVRAQSHELQMWLFLNDGEMHAAWGELMQAQSASRWAARWLPDVEPDQALDIRLNEIERVAFPKQMFFNPSMIINQKDVECTLCHKPGDPSALPAELLLDQYLRPRLSFRGPRGDRLASVVPLHWLFQESLNATSRDWRVSPAIMHGQRRSGGVQPNCNQDRPRQAKDVA